MRTNVMSTASNRRSKARRRVTKREGEVPACLGCGRLSTAEWRRGPTGPRTLCNACGLLFAKMSRVRRNADGASGGSSAASSEGWPSLEELRSAVGNSSKGPQGLSPASMSSSAGPSSGIHHLVDGHDSHGFSQSHPHSRTLSHPQQTSHSQPPADWRSGGQSAGESAGFQQHQQHHTSRYGPGPGSLPYSSSQERPPTSSGRSSSPNSPTRGALPKQVSAPQPTANREDHHDSHGRSYPIPPRAEVERRGAESQGKTPPRGRG
jgi:hypothetical protein